MKSKCRIILLVKKKKMSEESKVSQEESGEPVNSLPCYLTWVFPSFLPSVLCKYH